MAITKELWGWLYGFLGVLIFSLTLPATRIAVSELDPVFVGLGRAVIAGSLAVILLTITRQSIPPRKFWLRFAVVAIGVFSMFLGFFAWYQGLVWGGIAKVSQIQLLQPFLTILASASLLHEALTIRTSGFALGVIICVALSKRF